MALWQPSRTSLLVGKTGSAGGSFDSATAVGFGAGYSLTSAAYNCTFLGAGAGLLDNHAANILL